MAPVIINPRDGLFVPGLRPLDSISDLLDWYCLNVCAAEINDCRGFRVKFLPENFIHLIKLKNKFGKEPRNARMALEDIRRGRIRLKAGQFSPQRAEELSWAVLTAREPDVICVNWKADGHSGEAFIKNWGSSQEPRYRVLICEVHGTVRRPVTLFPREAFRGHEMLTKVWP